MVDPMLRFVHLQFVRMLGELEQAREFSNSYRSEPKVTTNIELVAVPDIGLLEFAHNYLAPPAVVGFPLKRQMSSRGHIHLHKKIDVQLKRTGIVMKHISLLLGSHEKLLGNRILSCLNQVRSGEEKESRWNELFHSQEPDDQHSFVKKNEHGESHKNFCSASLVSLGLSSSTQCPVFFNTTTVTSDTTNFICCASAFPSVPSHRR